MNAQFLIELELIWDKSIANETFYNFAFKYLIANRSVWSQIYENWRHLIQKISTIDRCAF